MADETTDLRRQFEQAMAEAGWTSQHNNEGVIDGWKYKTGYQVEYGNAFRFWQATGMTVMPW